MAEQKERCSDCGGTGKQDVYNEEKGEWEEQPCSTCGGSGEVTITTSDDPEE